MKLNPLFSTLTAIFYASQSCGATILVKFGQIQSLFLQHMKKGSSVPDPLVNFELRGRQLLCDVAINAKQFMVEYTEKYYERELVGGIRKNSLTGWSIFKDRMNFQRRFSSPSNPDSLPLVYKKRWTRVGAGRHESVSSLHCVHTVNFKWYLTFGFVDHFMFLLEEGNSKKNKYLLVTGLFEPSAVVRNRSLLYLRTQFSTSGGKSRMESICQLGTADVLRLCSAVFDALNKRDLTQINRVRKERRNFVTRSLRILGRKYRVNALRCLIIHGRKGVKPFYALADPREQGAVFVFHGRDIDQLYLVARVIRIGALLHPVGPKEVKLQPPTTMRDEDDSRCESTPVKFIDEKSTKTRGTNLTSGFASRREVSSEKDEEKESGEIDSDEECDEEKNNEQESGEEYEEEESEKLELNVEEFGKEGDIDSESEFKEEDDPELELYQAPANTMGVLKHQEYSRDLELLKTREDVTADKGSNSRNREQQTSKSGEEGSVMRRKKRSKRTKSSKKWNKLTDK